MSWQTFEFLAEAQYVKIGEKKKIMELWKVGLSSSFDDDWTAFLTALEILLTFDTKRSQCPAYQPRDDRWMPKS